MKRLNNLFEQIISIENLNLADKRASKGKSGQYGVIQHRKAADSNIWKLHNLLYDKKYSTSPYTTFSVYEPKHREVSRLPYFPDRIVHHAIMNVLEPVFVAMFTNDTYSCIKRKGIHAAAKNLRIALRNEPATQYCLKLDITKFYPSIDHAILKAQLRRKFKDKDLLWLLDEIIDSAPGVPIGNYLSQYLANFYLTGFDHWIKEVKREPYYFRYADDLVILSGSKEHLHALLADIRKYLAEKLNLQVKDNYQVFPIEARGIDFLGYVFRHKYIRLRKRIKQNLARKLAKGGKPQSIAAYYGWAKHCNSIHLMKKLNINETIQGFKHQNRHHKLHR